MNITDQFIENLYKYSKQSFAEEEINHAKKCLLDYLGVTIAGAKAYHKIEEALLESGIGIGGKSTVIGHGKKASLPIAALINGISAHAVELDDGQRYGNIHPGAPVISALIPIAEHNGLDLQDLWRGILVGYECTIRLACSIQPGHKLKGFHATGPCGTIGGAMAIAAMCNYNKEQYKSALSAACTSASGILEMIEGDTQMMPFNSGKAASNAVVAALVGLSGFKCPEDALGGKRGFLSCFATTPNLDMLINFSEKKYSTTNYFKIYAACGHCHSSIEAALKLRGKHLFRIDEIDHVDIQTYKLALQGHDHNIIDGVNSARMSIPYSTAVALIRGSADIEDFNEIAIQDQRLLGLTSKITVRENEELTKCAPVKRMAIVTVCSKQDEYVETVVYPKGQPENPLTLDDIKAKYHRYATWGGISQENNRQIEDMVLNSQKVYTVQEMMNLINR